MTWTLPLPSEKTPVPVYFISLWQLIIDLAVITETRSGFPSQRTYLPAFKQREGQLLHCFFPLPRGMKETRWTRQGREKDLEQQENLSTNGGWHSIPSWSWAPSIRNVIDTGPLHPLTEITMLMNLKSLQESLDITLKGYPLKLNLRKIS